MKTKNMKIEQGEAVNISQFTNSHMKRIKRKKSLADISKQFGRLAKAAEPARFAKIAEIDRRYRLNILDRFGCSYTISDRAYYTPVTRRCYAGY